MISNVTVRKINLLLWTCDSVGLLVLSFVASRSQHLSLHVKIYYMALMSLDLPSYFLDYGTDNMSVELSAIQQKLFNDPPINVGLPALRQITSSCMLTHTLTSNEKHVPIVYFQIHGWLPIDPDPDFCRWAHRRLILPGAIKLSSPTWSVVQPRLIQLSVDTNFPLITTKLGALERERKPMKSVFLSCYCY